MKWRVSGEKCNHINVICYALVNYSRSWRKLYVNRILKKYCPGRYYKYQRRQNKKKNSRKVKQSVGKLMFDC